MRGFQQALAHAECRTVVCNCPAQVVSQRFPQNSIGAVGSAMFLRFINPAIVSPYEAGILDKKPPPRIERGLKLMSKVRPETLVLSACALCSTCFSTALSALGENGGKGRGSCSSRQVY